MPPEEAGAWQAGCWRQGCHAKIHGGCIGWKILDPESWWVRLGPYARECSHKEKRSGRNGSIAVRKNHQWWIPTRCPTPIHCERLWRRNKMSHRRYAQPLPSTQTHLIGPSGIGLIRFSLGYEEALFLFMRIRRLSYDLGGTRNIPSGNHPLARSFYTPCAWGRSRLAMRLFPQDCCRRRTVRSQVRKLLGLDSKHRPDHGECREIHTDG